MEKGIWSSMFHSGWMSTEDFNGSRHIMLLCAQTLNSSQPDSDMYRKSLSTFKVSWLPFMVMTSPPAFTACHWSLSRKEYFNLIATTIEYIADLNHGRWPAGPVAEVVYVVMLTLTSPNRCGDRRLRQVDPLTRWACCGFFHCEIFFVV